MDNTTNQLSQQVTKSYIKIFLIRFFMLPVLLGILIFLPARTFNYWQLYVYGVILVLPMVIGFSYFLKNDPQLMERRSRPKEKEKAQVFIQTAFAILIISGYVISGLDKHNAWSNIPFHIVLIADLFLLLGYTIIFLVFKQNSFASNIVEVDSNQKVISTGLYKWVRHPMYVGLILLIIPTPIALGSYWALIPVVAIPFTLVLRILNEENVLRKQLPGYSEYCQKTKFRLIPFIW